MIFVKGYGQMCNNILQFAHAYAYGREHGIKVVAMRFCYKYRYFELCNQALYRPITYLIAKFLIKSHLIKCLKFDRCDVPSEYYRLLNTQKIIALDDWLFRHPELFLKYREEIKQLFRFKPNVIKRQKEWLETVERDSTIKLGVHIRRGDYARFMGGKYFFSDEVFATRIKEFSDMHPDKTIQVFICSNDSNLSVDKFKQLLNNNEVFLSQGNPAEDLYMLSECQYIIGPKSTFSLMASFYNNAQLHWMEDKDVCLTDDKFKHFEDLFMSI
jgi:hypothetical protein